MAERSAKEAISLALAEGGWTTLDGTRAAMTYQEFQSWARLANAEIMKTTGTTIVPQLHLGPIFGWVGVGWWIQVEAHGLNESTTALAAFGRAFSSQNLDYKRDFNAALGDEGAKAFGKDAADFIRSSYGLSTEHIDLFVIARPT